MKCIQCDSDEDFMTMNIVMNIVIEGILDIDLRS